MKRAVLSFVTLVTATSLSAQMQPAPAHPSPQQPKNVQLLKGMSPMELIRAMQFISVSLGVNCDFCHVFKPGGERDFGSDDKEEKRTARDMIRLVMDDNTKFFHDRPVVSCNTCHRGSPNPVNVPVLPVSAPQPRPKGPPPDAKSAMPTRDDIVARYSKALGNSDPKAIATMELKGTRDMAGGSAPIDVMISHGKTRINTITPDGQMVIVANGNTGWMADAHGSTHPMQQIQLDSTNSVLEALRLILPTDIPADARVGKDRVGDRDVWVLTSPNGSTGRQRLYFDTGSGLLVRRLTFTGTPIGSIPQQTDFDDYRDVGGFKLPFVVHLDSVDRGASRVVRYTEITPNAKIDENVFVQPQ